MNFEKLKETARKYEQKEDWKRAIEVYLQAVQEFESGQDTAPDLSVYNRIGDLYLKANEPGAAVQAYERAADLYRDQGFYNNAIALCGKILRVNPGRIQTYLKLAHLHARKNVVIEAKKNLLEYLERMNALNQLDDAFKAVKDFADQFPTNKEIRLMLSELLRASSRFEEAKEQLEKLASDLEARGDTIGARRTLARLQAMEVEDSPATAKPTKPKGGELIFLDTGADFGSPSAPHTTAASRKPPPPRHGPEPTTRAIEALSVVSTQPAPVIAPEPEVFAPEAEPMETTTSEIAIETSSQAEAPMDLESAQLVSDEAHIEMSHLEVAQTLGFEPTRVDTEAAGGVQPLDGLEIDEPLPDTVDLESAVPDLGLERQPDFGNIDAEAADTLAVSPIIPEEFDDPDELTDDLADDLDVLEFGEEGAEDVEVDEAGLGLELIDPDAPLNPTQADDRIASEIAELVEQDYGDMAALEEQPVEGEGELVEFEAVDSGEVGDEVDGGDFDAEALDVEEIEADEIAMDAIDADIESEEDAEFFGSDVDSEGEVVVGAGQVEMDEGSTGPGGIGPLLRETAGLAFLDTTEPARISITSLEDMVLDDPENPETHRALGEALLATGDGVRGQEELELALSAYENREDWMHAGDLVNELVRIDPNGVRYHQKRVELAFRLADRPRLIDAYVELGDALMRVGAVDKALAVYRRVAEHDPGNPRALAALESMAPVEEEQVEPAAAEAVNAVGLPAEDEELERAMDALAADTSAPAAAEPTPAPPSGRSSTPTVRPLPKPPGAQDFVDLGAFIMDDDRRLDPRMRVEDEEPTGDEQRDFQDMLSQFKRGIDENIDAEDFQAHYDLGIAFREMGLLDEAIAEFQKALRAPEARLRTSEALGHAFFEKGQSAIAEAILKRAIESLGASDDMQIGLLYWLGRAREAQNKVELAVTCYERVLAVDIHFQDTGARMNRLVAGQNQ